MHCPECGCFELRVLTGAIEDGWRLRHRRCARCGTCIKTIELPADPAIAYRAPLGSLSQRGSRLALRAACVSLVRHLVAQLNTTGANT
jgi:hypothetical protein